MDINQILLALIATGIFAALIVLVVFVMIRLKESRYNHELKRVELDLMRKSLESKICLLYTSDAADE